MLMRYVSVDQKGKVTQQGNPKVLYSVMMYTRLQLLTSSTNSLAKALTIGIRYGLLRRQFKNYKDASGKLVERKIMDYQTHLYRFCPLLSFNFAILFATKRMYTLYDQMQTLISEKQDFSMLNPMHTILSGLKAFITSGAYEGTKIIRECCGASGFSQFSNLPLVID